LPGGSLTQGIIDTLKGAGADLSQVTHGGITTATSVGAENTLPANSTTAFTPILDDLRAEVERLKSSLAVAEALADERAKRLDQLVPLLTGHTKRRWWWF